MPTYEYQCAACEHRFEEFQSITAAPLRKCPDCGRLKLKRLMGTGAGIIFKGSGFYETDYRSESYSKAAKADSEAAKPKTETKPEGTTPTQPAAKTDSKPAATGKGTTKTPKAG